MLDTHLRLLDLCYFELGEAFKGLKDENVWKRPAPSLLSVGELAGHIVYWESTRLAGDGEPENNKVRSPLIDRRFRYFPATKEESPTEEHLAMTAEQVHSEMARIHQESVAALKALNPELTAEVKGFYPGATYRDMLEYQVFHIAYHTGQIYSARHLLGEETVDN